MVERLARNWWALALRGLCAVIFGIMAFAWPGIILDVLIILFGAYALANGILAIVASIMGQTQGAPGWVVALEGLVSMLVGVLTFVWPGDMAVALTWLIGFWAILTGALQIAAAISLRKVIEGEWALGLSGVLSILLGLILLLPGVGALALVWLIGGYAILFGMGMLALGLRLRDWETSRLAREATKPPASS